jgi:hypothetical protein
MALTEFTLTDADMGRALGVPDGFLVNLSVTAVPKGYEAPEWNPGTQRWTRGYLQLRGSGDSQNIFCASPSSWGFVSKTLVINQSLGYLGDLVVVCLPRGAVFELTLSDQPIDRTLKTSPRNLAEAGQALVATIMREAAERELVRR